MDDDVLTTLSAAIWKADEHLESARQLREKAAKLPQEVLKGLPEFRGEWTPEAVRDHLQQLNNWITDPLRAKNRTILESLGIPTQGISPEILDDSEGVEQIKKLLGEVASIDKSLKPALLDKHLVRDWLSEGTANTVQQLTDILEAKQGFKRLLSIDIPKPLIQALLLRSLQDPSFIPSAETIAAQVGFLTAFGISIEAGRDLDEFMDAVTGVHAILHTLQDEYGIPKETLYEQANGKSLHEAGTLLGAMEQDCIDQKQRLLDEWDIYFAALSSIGAKPDSASPPRAIPALRHQIEEFKEQCLKGLGEEGMALFRFMKGEGEFPETISMDSVKKALEALRPLILTFLKEEGHNAKS